MREPSNEGIEEKKTSNRRNGKMDNEMVIKEEKSIGQIIRENQHIKSLYLDDLIRHYEDNKEINKLKEEVAVVKNYKVMCELLREEEKTGNAKRSQQVEWKRYFDFEREGQKYIIKEIYDIPLPEGYYKNPIDTFNEFLICLYIKESNEKYPNQKGLVCGRRKLAEKLGLINDKYKKYQDKKNRLVYKIEGPIEGEEFIDKLNVVNKVYEDLPHRYKYRLEKAIKDLEKRSLILREEVYYGEKIKLDIDKNKSLYEVLEDNTYMDAYGDNVQDGYKIMLDGDTIVVPLTDNEKEKYSKISKDLRNSYLKKNAQSPQDVCETIKDLYDLGINPKTRKTYVDEYYERLEIETKSKMGYKTIFKAYRLYFHPEYIEEESWKLLNKLECIENNNRLFLEKMIKNAENKAIREIGKISESQLKEEIKEKKINRIEEEKESTIDVLETLIDLGDIKSFIDKEND